MPGSKGIWLLYGGIVTIFIIATIAIGVDYAENHAPPTKPVAKVMPQPTKKVALTAVSPAHICSPKFETGMVFPRWSPSGYGASDPDFARGLPAIKQQTGSCWIEMPLLFKMRTPNSLALDTSSAPTVANFAEGITTAKALGYHIFVVPLVTVSIKGGWAGSVQFNSQAGETQWFNLLFATYAPYIKVAEAEHVEQLSVGTELEWMQRNAPSSLWEHYIANVKSHFTGRIVYNENWSSLSDPVQPWMHQLSTIGVSEYIPLIDKPWKIAPPAMDALFKTRVLPKLDALSMALGKPIIVSEIGYRDSFDALYNPWEWDGTTHLPQDQQEQSWAVQTALENLTTDSHIQGTFFWAWHNSGALNLDGTQAAKTIGTIYNKL